ncbi:hypothetical protein [Streptomyces sp. NPDC048252]|uniref:hypothetical protein n=1 Tax=Streptomyces sp. NPDC048252 TaxID=3154612 RepID=UPI00343C058A
MRAPAQVAPGGRAVGVPSTARVTLLPRGALTAASAARVSEVRYDVPVTVRTEPLPGRTIAPLFTAGRAVLETMPSS